MFRFFKKLISQIPGNDADRSGNVYPPVEIQKRYAGIETLFANIFSHPENSFKLKPKLVIYLEKEYNPVINDYFTNRYGTAGSNRFLRTFISTAM